MEDTILAWLEKTVACLECLGRGAYRLCRCAQRIGESLECWPETARTLRAGLARAGEWLREDLAHAREQLSVDLVRVRERLRADLAEDRRVAGLAVRELRRRAMVQAGLVRAALAPRLPALPNLRLCAVLCTCLVLVFGLELAVLRVIIPAPPPLPAGTAACAPDLDPAYLNNVESLLAEFWLYPRPSPGISPLPVAASPLLDLSAPAPAGVAADGAAHPLLTLLDLDEAARFSGFPRVAPLPSVRLAVRRCEVRRPVDRLAFHPLDKEALLAAGTPYLSQLFALVENAPTARSSGHPATLPAATSVLARSASGARVAASSAHLPPSPLGQLSALFESGGHGVHAIGWDPRGGTSYGKYQMSSLMGTVDKFIAFLDERVPQWGVRLRQAGSADTGGVLGAMPRAWKRIAEEDPVRFERLQDSFIHSEYYSPTVLAISAETGLDVNAHPAVMREVLWSTAVLHGPTGGAEIFIEAARRVRDQPARSFNRALLEEVFRERARRISRSGNPKGNVLRRRLEMEKDLALAMLPGAIPQIPDRL